MGTCLAIILLPKEDFGVWKELSVYNKFFLWPKIIYDYQIIFFFQHNFAH